jgi:hypothetical protein
MTAPEKDDAFATFTVVLEDVRSQLEVLGEGQRGLRETMVAGFAAVDLRFDAIDVRFDRLDARFDALDARFDRMDARFDRMDA